MAKVTKKATFYEHFKKELIKRTVWNVGNNKKKGSWEQATVGLMLFRWDYAGTKNIIWFYLYFVYLIFRIFDQILVNFAKKMLKWSPTMSLILLLRVEQSCDWFYPILLGNIFAIYFRISDFLNQKWLQLHFFNPTLFKDATNIDLASAGKISENSKQRLIVLLFAIGVFWN